MRYLSFIFFLIHFSVIIAQDIKTDVYLFDIDFSTDTISFTNGQFLNQFNYDGYNNQACFIGETLVYLSSSLNAAPTDIIALDLKNTVFWDVTHTKEAEYSPVPCPDPSFFSVVRVEQDETTQLLWKYPIDQSNSGEAIFEQINNVGYYSWIDREHVAMYLVDDPARLVIGNTTTKSISIITEDIGRCLKTDADGGLYYVQMLESGASYLKKYNLQSRVSKIITKCIEGSEDFELLQDGSIVMASKSKLYQYNVETNTPWQEINDFSAIGLNQITRITSYNNKLILVNKK